MAQYDGFATEYDQAVKTHSPVIECAYHFVLTQLKDNVSNKRVCDLGCGQGELARRIVRMGAQVTGIDLSGELLKLASSYPSAHSIQWIQDDAQVLNRIPDEQFDVVVANLMLMDVPNFQNVFQSAYRVLIPNGALSRISWKFKSGGLLTPFGITGLGKSGKENATMKRVHEIALKDQKQFARVDATKNLSVQLALLDVMEMAKEGLLALAVQVGLRVFQAMVQEEVDALVGPKGKHNPERQAVRHGNLAACALGSIIPCGPGN